MLLVSLANKKIIVLSDRPLILSTNQYFCVKGVTVTINMYT